MYVCVCVIINLLIKTQTHKHTHTHAHAQAGKQTQTITCNAHSHTCKRYCKMRSPGAALYSLPPTPRCYIFSFILFSCSTPTAATEEHSTAHPTNAWIFIFTSIEIIFGFSCLLFVFPYRIYYSPFSMRACFVRSLIEFSLLRSAFAPFRSALSFSFSLARSL